MNIDQTLFWLHNKGKPINFPSFYKDFRKEKYVKRVLPKERQTKNQLLHSIPQGRSLAQERAKEISKIIENSNTLPYVETIKKFSETLNRYQEPLRRLGPNISAFKNMAIKINNTKPYLEHIQRLSESTSHYLKQISSASSQATFQQLQALQDVTVNEQTKATEEAITMMSDYCWAYSKKIDFSIYLNGVVIMKEIREEESVTETINEYFADVVENFIMPDLTIETFEKGLRSEWNDTSDYLIQQIQQKNMFAAIPLLLICIDRVFYNVDNSLEKKKNPGKAREGFQSKTTKDEKILSYLVQLNIDAFLEDVIPNKLFTNQNKEANILNRNRVSHGKSNPANWSVAQMYQLLAILVSLCEVAEEFFKYKININGE